MNGEFEAAAVALGIHADRLRDALAKAGNPSEVIEAPGFSVVATPVAKSFWKTRKKAGQALVARQRLLEIVHAAAPVLPVAPGTSFADVAELNGFLVANTALLFDGLDQFGDLEQHQIMVDLPFETALARLSASEGWAELQAAGAAARTAAEKRAFGAQLAAAAGKLSQDLARSAFTRLAEAAVDIEQLPVGEETTALNAALLCERDGSDLIESALEAIDAEWSGALKIRMIGPSPASSFASVLIEQTDFASAAAELGLATDAAPEEVDAAYRRIMKEAHPDLAGPDSTDRAARIAAATSLMRRSAEARASLASAGMSQDAAPLARLYRESERGGAN